MLYYESAIMANPNCKIDLIDKGDQLFQLEEYDEAKVFYEAAI